MRVITGSARGRKLSAPPGLETRPTSELVKEAVFSMIQFEVEGARALDLFAGTGQMGIEALSRGAQSCVFVENSRQALAALAVNIENTGFAGQSRIMRADALSYLKSAAGPFDFAFLDPPYQAGLLEDALPLVAAIMRESGIIICETDTSREIPETAGAFIKYREYRYGKTRIAQYRAEA
jgi:16S rRNA (guanine(966)-N(2))-methyltransferase RsmD